MTQTGRRLALVGIFALAAAMFFTGINWGLPSRDADRFLFGARAPWSGAQIIELAGGWDESAGRGADIAMRPLTGRDKPIAVNQTDAQRAEIVRRYRLYSAQPDEMITFRSLSRMKPGRGDLDPQFYQYGGLWVYPIGALLKIASMLKLVTLRSDLAFYLDHPEAFARFYLVARLYAAAWGLVGVGVVFALGRQWSGRFGVGAIAALLYAAMPVVLNMAHEAKPHLPGTVLTLAAVLAGMRFVRTGSTRASIIAGALCGAAFGMVLTGIVSFAVLPVMTLLRPTPWRRRIALTMLAGSIGALVFVVTNPYLPYNYLFRRSVVQSNVGNYGNFYQPELSLSAMRNALILMAVGMSWLLIAGVASVLVVSLSRSTGVPPVSNSFNTGERAAGSEPVLRSPLGWLLAAPALLVLLQYVLLARDKPAEYARFALTLDVALAITAAVAVGMMRRKPLQWLTAMLLVGSTALSGGAYVANFIEDTRPNSTRRSAANELARIERPGRVLAVWAEPAPYCLPPVNLFDWRIVLLPKGTEPVQFAADRDWPPDFVSVRPTDDQTNTPASWSNKKFVVADTKTNSD